MVQDENKNCSNCSFEKRGFCLKYPPQVVFDGEIKTVFPQVNGWWFCSEWETKN